jgi:hemolysin activation/secretion protein
VNNVPEPLDSTRSSGHSAEIGLRLRGPLTRKLFYGVDASWLGLALNDNLERTITVNSLQRDRAQRTSAALGLGYFLNQRTVLSLDLAAGTSLAGTDRTQASDSLLLQSGAQHSWFGSANVGVQTNISSHLFLNASFLYIT